MESCRLTSSGTIGRSLWRIASAFAAMVPTHLLGELTAAVGGKYRKASHVIS